MEKEKEFWEDRDENGKLVAIINYNNGKRNGLSEEWDSEGNLKESKIYKDGEWVKDNLSEEQDIRFRERTKAAPKKTIKSYKLFRTDNQGNLYTLFIDNSVPLKIGTWYDADSPQMDVLAKLPHTKGEKEIYLINKDNSFTKWEGSTALPKISEVENASNNQGRYIQVSDSKNGNKLFHNVGINGARGVSLYAMRAGMHSTNVPSAHHIGIGRNGAKAANRPDNQVWAEIEVSADVNYQDEALSNAPIVTSKSSANYGKPNMAMAQITDKIPIDGYYIYQTNANANKAQDWIISGAMKINKVSLDNTTKKIARDLGFDEDLPRVQEKVNRFNELLNGESNNRYHTINIDGVERPTVNSLGKPIASTEEGLRNFWKWFGDSKVVDSEGLPLVVYHGTRNGGWSIPYMYQPMYLTTNKNVGKGYAKSPYKRLFDEVMPKGGNIKANTGGKKYSQVYSFYVKADEINEIDAKGNSYLKFEFNDNLNDRFSGLRGLDDLKAYVNATRIPYIVRNIYDNKDYNTNDISDIIVALPNQIKSVNNTGTFDSNNDDIRFRNTITIDGVERPAVNSLGQPIAGTEEGLRNFWKWFGDSKVVDEKGLPLVVYHGTGEDFNIFKKTKSLRGNALLGNYYEVESNAFFFADNREYAENVANIKANKVNEVKEVYLKSDYLMAIEDYSDIEAYTDITEEEHNNRELDFWHYLDNKDFVKRLKGEEVDGVIFYEYNGKIDTNVYVVFSPNQIKSVNNTGTFDSNNDDIRFREKIQKFDAYLSDEYETEREKKKKTLEERKNEIEIALFNKFKPLKDIHEKMVGAGIYTPFNIYHRTVSADSRINGKIDRFDKTLGKALKESIAKVQKKGISYNEIGIYFQAQFMPERTAQLIDKKIGKDFILNNMDETIQKLEDEKVKNLKNLKLSSNEIEKLNNKIDKKIAKVNEKKGERVLKIRNKFEEKGLAGEQGLKEFMESKGLPKGTPEDYIKLIEDHIGDKELVDELNKNKAAIVKYTLDTALKTGQISKDQYDEFRSTKNYVPLRGWEITFDDSGEDNIFQSVSKVAEGRKSLAANPINYLYAMAYTSVNFGEKNILKNNLAILALMNRSNPLFSDSFGYNEFYSGFLIDEEGNEVPFEVTSEEEYRKLEGVIKEKLVIRMLKEKFDNLNSQNNPHKYDEEYNKHILTFYDNGIRHEIYIEDVNIVNAFKSDKMTKTQAALKKGTSYVTKFMTSRNISFIPANLIRDIQTTMFLNKYYDDAKKDAAFKGQIINNMRKVAPSVMKGVWKNDWNTDKEIGQAYNDWLIGGGRTGWLQSFKDVDALQKNIEKDIANTNEVKKFLYNRYHFKATEACAEFSENLVRFSVYYTAVRNGFTKEQAIWFSNDASLNFNLKGAKGNWLRSVYGFWNASLAGFYKVGKFSWENKERAAATFATFMLAGFGKWWLDNLFDDDEEKRSEYKKQRMFTILGVGIPMSYDLLPPYRIGYMLADVMFGDLTATKFGYETAMSFTEIMPEQAQAAATFLIKYNPKRDKIEYMNIEEMAGLTPTVIKPLSEIFITNRDFMGQEIQPESRYKDLPHSARYREERVTELDKLVSNVLNGLQGFDWANLDEESKFTSNGKKRIIDVSPAVIHHLVSSYYSGTAQIVMSSSDLAKMLTDDKDDDFNKISGKIPVINRFYIPANESTPIYSKLEKMQAKYADLLENEKEINSVIKDKNETPEKKAQYEERLGTLRKNPLYNEAMRYKSMKDEISDLRKQLRLANKLGQYERINELRMQLDKIEKEIK